MPIRIAKPKRGVLDVAMHFRVNTCDVNLPAGTPGTKGVLATICGVNDDTLAGCCCQSELLFPYCHLTLT